MVFLILSVLCVARFVCQDLERTAERGRNESIRPGCSAAFSVPGDEGGELLVLTAELREEQVRFQTACVLPCVLVAALPTQLLSQCPLCFCVG